MHQQQQSSQSQSQQRIKRSWKRTKRACRAVFCSATFWCLAVLLAIAVVLHHYTHVFDTKQQFMYVDNIAGRDYTDKLSYEPFDVVYTWVNGSDPRHKTLVEHWKRLLKIDEKSNSAESDSSQQTATPVAAAVVAAAENTAHNSTRSSADGDAKPKQDDVIGSNRFRDNDELRYSLRSLEKFAGWIRHIYIVTNGQVPSWLNLQNPRVRVVTHAEIFQRPQEDLPTFSSPAIEANLYRIPGISSKFIYLNDDVMFGNVVLPEDFFSHSTGQRVFLSWDAPGCNEGCQFSYIGDGYCDLACNVSACEWDGGDCYGVDPSQARSSSSSSSWWSSSSGSYSSSSSYSWGSSGKNDPKSRCSSSCYNNWLADKFCDSACNTADCAFDAGDCGIDDLKSDVPSYVLLADEFSTPVLQVKYGTPSLYFNLTKIFPIDKSKITDGETEVEGEDESNGPMSGSQSSSGSLVYRSSTILQQQKLLIYTMFKRNDTDTTRHLQIRVNGTVTQGSEELPKSISLTVKLLSKEESEAVFAGQKPAVAILALPKPTAAAPKAAAPQDQSKSLHEQDSKAKHKTVEEDEDESVQRLIQRRNAKQGKTTTGTGTTQKTKKSSSGNDDSNQDDEVVYQRKARTNSNRKSSRRSSRRLSSIEDATAVTSSITLPIRINDIKEEKSSRKSIVEQQFQELQVKQQRLESIASRLAHFRDQDAEAAAGRSPTSRHLLDKFSDSLAHVGMLLNREYGRAARKVPAHMPHMIQRDVFAELHGKWEGDFNATSSHKFRDSDDMQFAFSYFYYLMHETKKHTSESFFREKLDRNGDGLLQDFEIRQLALMFRDKKVKLEKIRGNSTTVDTASATPVTPAASPKPAEAQVAEAQVPTSTNTTSVSENDYSWSTSGSSGSGGSSSKWSWSWDSSQDYSIDVQEYIDAIKGRLNESLYKSNSTKYPNYDSFLASGLDDLCLKTFGKIDGRFPYSLETLDQVGFHMIGDDINRVLKQLDELRTKQPKFICLNDDMNKTSPNPEVVEALHEFYTWYFPHPSQFELPEGEHNPYYYMDEMNSYLKMRKTRQYILIGAAAVVAIFLCCVSYCCVRRCSCCRGKRKPAPSSAPSAATSSVELPLPQTVSQMDMSQQQSYPAAAATWQHLPQDAQAHYQQQQASLPPWARYSPVASPVAVSDEMTRMMLAQQHQLDVHRRHNMGPMMMPTSPQPYGSFMPAAAPMPGSMIPQQQDHHVLAMAPPVQRDVNKYQ